MRQSGFSLPELLLTLLILATIATFSIPKILSTQQSTQKNAVTKETASAIAAAYNIYKLENTAEAATSMHDITPYMNYVAIDTTSVLDHRPPNASTNCSAGSVHCLAMHNGGKIWHANCCNSFGGTTASDSLNFLFDPDGEYNGGAAEGKAVEFFLYFNGRLTTRAVVSGNASQDPTWFSWD